MQEFDKTINIIIKKNSLSVIIHDVCGVSASPETLHLHVYFISIWLYSGPNAIFTGAAGQ